MKIVYFIIVLMVLTGCGVNENTVENENSLEADADVIENVEEEDVNILAEGLEIPWAIAEYENVFYLTERNGAIVRIEDNMIERQELHLLYDLFTEGEAGLLGFVLDPQFEENEEGYIYYTYQLEDGAIYNKVAKVKWDQQEQVWREQNHLVELIPGDPIHNGGRLKIGHDEKLYVTTGDANVPEYSQDKSQLAGSILRVELDGSVPPDNPTESSYIYSFGHRNPQGLAWGQELQLFSTEHGPTAHDEINEIESQSNYGWPEIVGDEEMDGMVNPLIHSGDDTWAPSGAAVLGDYLYFAGLRGEGVFRYHVHNQDLEQVVHDYGRIRDVYIKDDLLFFITNNRDGRGSPEEEDDRFISIPINALNE